MSEVSISNLALSHLGAASSIVSLNEASFEAQQCKLWYPVARDVALESHAWTWGTRRAAPAQVTIDEDVYGAWTYAYRAPAQCLKILGVYAAGYTDDLADGLEFTTESDDLGDLILVNDEIAALRYVARVTDTTRFSPLFADAVSWLLASYLAGVLLKGEAGQQSASACFATYTTQIGRAAVSNATKAKRKNTHTPDWIAARA